MCLLPPPPPLPLQKLLLHTLLYVVCVAHRQHIGNTKFVFFYKNYLSIRWTFYSIRTKFQIMGDKGLKECLLAINGHNCCCLLLA